MGVADAFTAILDEIAAAKAAVPHPIRATVTHADPLLVVLDDDPDGEPREVTDDAAGVWAVDDIVWLELRGTDLVVTTAPTSMARLREDADDLRTTVDQHTLYNAELADFVTTQVAFAEAASERLDGLDGRTDAAQQTADDAAAAAADRRISLLTTTGAAKFPAAVIDALVGDEAYLRAVYTSRLVVASDNLVADPGFAHPLGTAWRTWGGDLAPWSTEVGWLTGDAAIGTGWREIGTHFVPVNPGDTLVGSVRALATAFSGSTYPRIGIWYYNQAGTRILTSAVSLLTLVEATVTTQLTAPADSAYAVLVVSIPTGATSGTIRVSSPVMRRKVGSILLEDGAVTAEKITASVELSAKVAEFLDVSAERVFVGGRPILDEVGEQIGDLSASTASSLADGLDAVDTAAADRLDSAIAGVTGQLDQLDTWRESLDNYVLIDGGGIFIGNRTDDFRVNINSTRMSFIEGDKEVAYISNQALYIGDATITGTLTQGGFYWEAQTDGRLDFKWGG